MFVNLLCLHITTEAKIKERADRCAERDESVTNGRVNWSPGAQNSKSIRHKTLWCESLTLYNNAQEILKRLKRSDN